MTPTDVVFTPSIDHDTLWSDGQAVLTNYLLQVDGSDGSTHTKDLGKPTPAGGVIVVVVPELATLAPGTYHALVTAIGPGGAQSSLTSPPWTIAAPVPPIPAPAPPTDVRVQEHTDPATLWAHTVTAPGWATFLQVLPPGYARNLQLGELPTQVDVKTRWSDGTIRQAVVTAHVEAAGTYPLRPMPERRREFIYDGPFPARPGRRFAQPVIFTAGPRVEDLRLVFTLRDEFDEWVATLPLVPSENVWLDGPLVHERRELLVPVSETGEPHPLLQVFVDVRDYADGMTRFDLQVQNCRNSPDMDVVQFDLDVFYRSALLWNVTHVDLYLGNRYRRVLPVNGLREAEITLDLRPVWAAGAFPKFLPSLTGPTYPPLDPNVWGTPGNMQPYMMNGGGRPEIAPRVWWDAQQAMHPTPEMRATCLGNGNCSGYWTTAICEPDGVTICRLDRHPGFWFDGRDQWSGTLQIGHQPSGALMGQRPDFDADPQHVPAVNYFPYLLTGDRWHVDQMRHWANWAVVKTYPGDSYLNGIDWSRLPVKAPPFDVQDGLLTQNGARGLAWTLRLVVDAAVALPDGDPDKLYFHGIVAQQLKWLDAYAQHQVRDPALPPLDAATAAGGPTEAVFWERDGGTSEPPYTQITIWQVAYDAAVVQQAIDHGDWGALGRAFRDRAIRFQLKYVTSEAEGYPFEYGFGYYPRTGVYEGENQGRSAIRLGQSMQTLFDHDYTEGVVIPPNPVKAAQPIVGYYGVEGYVLLALGQALGVPQAGAALARLLAVPGMVGDLQYRAGFAVDYRGARP